jgi:hypothetical protein
MTSAVDDKPSLAAPRAKLRRAELHLRTFESAWQKVIDAEVYSFIHEVNADGVSHRYRAVTVPDLDDRWALMLGDCVHNLRASLDYLAFELVRANGGTPDHHTTFPVHSAPGGVRVHGGVAGEALHLIEEVQPYADTEEGNRIRAVDLLDRADRGRPMLLAAAATGHNRSSVLGGSSRTPQIVEVWTSDRPLEVGKTVHGYTYNAPFAGEDPNIKVLPHLVIDDPVVEREFGRVAASILIGDRLIPWLREQFFPRFEQFFG